MYYMYYSNFIASYDSHIVLLFGKLTEIGIVIYLKNKNVKL
jgi:hypothetical protein